MTFKEKVHKHCMKVLNTKIQLLQQTLHDLKESASNETKSTAGDKHETALAMLQIEQANTGRQLDNLMSQKLLLQKISPAVYAKQITKGALVKTNKGYFFISIALGRIMVEGTPVVTLSPQSPLGSKLMGLNLHQTTVVNEVEYFIESLE